MLRKLSIMLILVLLFVGLSCNSAQAYEVPDRYIDVCLSEQTVTLYLYGMPLRTFPIVSGKLDTPTRVGWYHVYYQTECQDMKGDGYFLRNVHYCTYFDRGIGFLEAYWRNLYEFGDKTRYLYYGSHGCINMTYEGALYVYDFVRYGNGIGTLVWVRE